MHKAEPYAPGSHRSREVCVGNSWYIWHKSEPLNRFLLGKRGYRVKCVESRGLRVETKATAKALPSASRKRFRIAGRTSRVSSDLVGEAGIQGQMCGIAGFTRRNKGDRKGVAERITEAISHRGPDQQGIFEGSEATLCAVRLKIIDLEGGNQPILSDDRDTAIVFNGEIYNHLEIRAELEGLGHRFHSNCDTETVLRAYLEWDTACFSRMRGMFAVALWTESEKRLVLVRDRMGIKPLYYYRNGEELYFGSELKAILEHPEVPRHLDLDALDRS